MRKPIRFICRLAVYLALGLLCALLTSRWWLPAALPPLLGMWSVEVASVERSESGGLRLSNLAVDAESLRVEADWVELPSEWRYVQERFAGEWSEAAGLRIGRVELRAAAGAPDVPGEPLYLPQLLTQIRSGLDAAAPWLPPLAVEEIRWLEGDEALASIRSLAYGGRRASGVVATAWLEGEWPVEVDFGSGAPWRLDFSHPDTGLSGALRIESRGGHVGVEGELRRADSLLEYAAEFGGTAWWPLEARVASGGFDLPELRLPLGGGVALGQVKLSQLEATGAGERYRLNLAGDAQLRGGDGHVEPITFELKADGGMEAIRVEALSLRSGWASLRLSEPLRVDWRRRSFEGDAHLEAVFDLSGQQWLDARGEGRAALVFDGASPEAFRFQLDASGLAYGTYTADSIAAAGGFGGRVLRLDSLTLQPAGAAADGGLDVAGVVDFGVQALNLEYSALLDAAWLNALLGRPLLLEPLALEAGRVSGEWGAPEVSGRLRTALQTEATEAIELDGAFRWDGADAFGWSGEARCDGAAIAAEARARREGGAWSLWIDSLGWTDPERPELQLEAPLRIGWSPGDGSFEERLSVSAFALRGADLAASGAYDPAQGLELLLTNVSLARIDRWLRADLPGYHVESVACAVTAFRPFIVGSVDVAAEERIDGNASVRLELAAELGAQAIEVGRVALDFAGEEVLMGDVRLPLRLRMPGAAPGGRFHQLGEGSLGGTLRGRSSPAFSEWLQGRTGLRLEAAMVDMELAGDWSHPVGHLDLRVEELGLGSILPDLALPSVRGLDVQLRVDEQSINVRKLAFSINESGVEAELRMPVAAFSDLSEPNPVEWLRAATGTVRLDGWEMENWVDWAPPYLRRSGRLTGTFELAPPLNVTGALSFADFGLRPTESLAAVDQIGGRIRLADRIVRIDETSARLGGSRVELTGQIDFTDWTQPRWSFDVAGRNVPIRRSTEMILRSDLDIRLAAEDPAQAPLLSGELGLRSSTLLVDFDPLAPRLKKGTAVQPPFFSVTEPPFADWRLDLRAAGESFMRVRSPYFNTKLSADLQLKGTFAEPELLGSVRTLEGELRFPGAKFVLDAGEAYIEASRPNEVQLDFSGIAQKASRVIVMEVSQTLEEPLIQFQSTPPMSQAAIVRFLATGSTTGGGVGNIGIYLGQGMLGPGGMDDLLVDRLTVDLGEETSRSGRNTLGARYELSPEWAVEGEYDVYDAYNVDLIWSIFQR